jgi:pyrroline-5-carboxylate reductase
MKVLFVGGGNMASALIGGLTQRGWAGSDCSVVEIDEAARRRLSERFGARVLERLPTDFDAQDAVVLAVKHTAFRTQPERVAGLLAEGGVLVDVKRVFDAATLPSSIVYWSL